MEPIFSISEDDKKIYLWFRESDHGRQGLICAEPPYERWDGSYTTAMEFLTYLRDKGNQSVNREIDIAVGKAIRLISEKEKP